MASFFISMGLFKGKTLAEELAFVRWYHKHPINLTLHTIGVPFLLYSIFALLHCVKLYTSPSFTIHLSHVFSLLYVVGFTSLDLLAGFCSISVFYWMHQLLDYADATSQYWLIAFSAALFAAVTQLTGHFKYEKDSPAFRFFEAVFTTPFFILLNILFVIGWKPKFYKQIKTLTPMWKGVR
eukprot:GILJ01010046.1.p1 GENE.GILJ01010046.1~~GILJ01010046.1.p1  ORF type:complete len:181 (+),score=20.36 GILJ01010046.1:57-599(+)